MSTTTYKYLRQNFHSLGQSLISKDKVKIVEKKGLLYYDGTLLTTRYLKRRIAYNTFVDVLSFDFELSDTPFTK